MHDFFMLLWDIFDVMSMPKAKRRQSLIIITSAIALTVVIALAITYIL